MNATINHIQFCQLIRAIQHRADELVQANIDTYAESDLAPVSRVSLAASEIRECVAVAIGMTARRYRTLWGGLDLARIPADRFERAMETARD